jgi:tripartite-type tricarboxylate transporter receptor subunit TctC
MLAPVPVRADPSADFYKGKTITLAVYSSPGGDYDVRARLVARHMDRHIPGAPNIIVQNMPGSGGLKAANWLYNVAPKDGTALATLNQQMPLTQAFGTKGVEFDLGRCAWIGNTMSSPIALVTWHTAKAKTMEDTFKVETTMGGTGAGSGSVQFPLMLNALIGTKFKVIAGYPGGSQIYLAMERGEVDGRATQNWAGWVAQRPNWIKEKKINVLAQGGTAPLPDPDLKGVPLLVDYAKTPEARAVVELFLLPDEVARPIIAGPNLPKERIAALRTAFNATMKDPAFLDEARKGKMEIIASSGEEAQAKALKILHAPKAILDKAKQYAGN